MKGCTIPASSIAQTCWEVCAVVEEAEFVSKKIKSYVDGPWFWGGLGLILGVIGTIVSGGWMFVIGFIPMAAGVVRSKFFENKSILLRVAGNLLLCAVIAIILFGTWKVLPKSVAKPLTLKDVQDAIAQKLNTPLPPQQGGKKEISQKPATAAEIANDVAALWQKRQSDQELLQKEYAFAKQLRKFEADHKAAVQKIYEDCSNGLLHDNTGARHGCYYYTRDEDSSYERSFNAVYVPQGTALANEMLTALSVNESARESFKSPSDLADYLDQLAVRIP